MILEVLNNQLNESLDHNRLYHKTNAKAGLQIIRDNCIKAGGNYACNKLCGPCVCLSRNFTFIKSSAYIIFVLDRDKLNSNYKLIPTSDYKNNANNNAPGRFTTTESKAEEICKSDICNLDRYIEKIIVPDEGYDEFINLNLIKDKNFNICKFSDYKVNESLNENYTSQQIPEWGASYILLDGTFRVCEKEKGRLGSFAPHNEPEFMRKGYPQVSNHQGFRYHGIRIYVNNDLSTAQYNTIEKLLDNYLDRFFICSIWLIKKETEADFGIPLNSIAYYLPGCEEKRISDSACKERKEGNWTGYKIVQDIKRYLNKYKTSEKFESYQKLVEATRSQLINKTKTSKNLRWQRKNKCKVANSVKDYNKIDMDKFFKSDELTFKIRVEGETNTYFVTIDFKNIHEKIQKQVKKNKNKLELKLVYLALFEALNSSDVKVDCSCPDYKFRFKVWATKQGYNAGDKETREAKITNPNDNLGAACKHILCVLNNVDWLKKIASVINNYTNYAKDNMENLYAKYIFPKIYGITSQKVIDLANEDSDKLKSDEELINLVNALGKDRGKIKKGSNKNPVAQKEREESKDKE